MGFWIFMLIMDLLIPLTLIGFGRFFVKRVPSHINIIFGYRTGRSMKNKDTWEFAHKYCGRLWYIWGMILFPLTVVSMLCVIGKSEDMIGTIGAVLCGIQLIPLVGCIVPTERALKRSFDKNGNRKEAPEKRLL